MKAVVVTVSDESLASIDKLADQLGKKGLKVEKVMPITGVITGSLATSKFASIKKVPGVQSLAEDEIAAQLPPPGQNPQ